MYLPGLVGLALGLFLAREATTAYPMLPLELFKRRNFAAGNIETFAMYAGLSVLFFDLVLFLQQVAGYSAVEAGLATLPTTLAAVFGASKRAGVLADRYGPRAFMGGGPLVAAAGPAADAARWRVLGGKPVNAIAPVPSAFAVPMTGCGPFLSRPNHRRKSQSPKHQILFGRLFGFGGNIHKIKAAENQ